MTVEQRRDRRAKERDRATPQRRKNSSPGGRRPKWLGPVIGVLIVAAAIAALFMTGFIGAPAARVNLNDPRFALQPGEVVGTQFKEEGKGHVDGQSVTYATTPPTSGNHWSSPVPWGVYDKQQPNERTTHNLEHGGIVISYSGLAVDEAAKLKALVDQLRSTTAARKILLQPYSTIPDGKIALSAWTWQLKLQTVDEAQVVRFITAHYEGKDAPEPGAN